MYPLTWSQNSDGDPKHRNTDKSKAFFVIQRTLTFGLYRYTPFQRYRDCAGK